MIAALSCDSPRSASLMPSAEMPLAPMNATLTVNCLSASRARGPTKHPPARATELPAQDGLANTGNVDERLRDGDGVGQYVDSVPS